MLSTEETEGAAKHEFVQIKVNERPVRIEGPRSTGLKVKEAAIAQGVEIQLDFILYLDLGGGHTKTIDNADPVTVHEGTTFTAIDNDDNS